MRMFGVLVLAFVVLLAFSSLASAEPPPPEPNWLVLKPSEKTSGAPYFEESGAELVLSSCAFASKGHLVENKAVLDTLKFSTLFTNESGKENCEATPGSEQITEATVSTSGEGSNATLTYTGSMKYRTTSPACTYKTPEYVGEFLVRGSVKVASMRAKGELIEGESGCTSTVSVTGEGILHDLHTSSIYYAERKSEK